MELALWVSTVLVLLTTVLLLKAVLRRNRRKYNLPPGPKSWPIIGNLNLIGALPHRSIHELSGRYGQLMHLRFGSFPVVVGSSVEMAKFFLKTHDVVFIDRPKTAAGKYTAFNCLDITWSPYNAYWRQARKIFLAELFSTKRLESYEYIRHEEVQALLCDLHMVCGRVITIREHLFTVNLNVITRMVLGKRYLQLQGKVVPKGVPVQTPSHFRWLVEELFFLNGVFNVGDLIPWLDWLDLEGYIKRMKKLSKMFDQLLEYAVEEHNEQRRQEGKGFVARDMMGVLLQLADDSNHEAKLSRDNIKAINQDLIAGGTESSTETVECGISELLKKPEVLAKATEELDCVIGRQRWVTEGYLESPLPRGHCKRDHAPASGRSHACTSAFP
uniref:Cytochrome P450 n=1 Tax=Oryza ridleyi TaxID=83308 RepID=A0A8K0YC02_9ORYZ|nr:cytochrome P450 [Oryza ridleyi]